jgi:hypothetical protein
MNQTCDRCGPAIGAAYRVDRIGELYLCGGCASRRWRALSAPGWTFWPLVDRQASISWSRCASVRAVGLLCPGERGGGAW